MWVHWVVWNPDLDQFWTL